MFVTVFNQLQIPVTIDGQGHTLGGQEFGSVDDEQDYARWALTAGTLRQIDATHPVLAAAAAAVTQTNMLEGRAATIAGWDANTLEAAAGASGLHGLEGNALICALALSDVTVGG